MQGVNLALAGCKDERELRLGENFMYTPEQVKLMCLLGFHRITPKMDKGRRESGSFSISQGAQGLEVVCF